MDRLEIALVIVLRVGPWLVGLPWRLTTGAQRWCDEPPCPPRQAWWSAVRSVLLVALFSARIPFLDGHGWGWSHAVAWISIPAVWAVLLMACGALAWRCARQSHTLALCWRASLCVGWLSSAPSPCCQGDFNPRACLPFARPQ